MPVQYLVFIILVVAAFLSVTISGFVVFSKFLDIEKGRADRFRAVHAVQKDKDKN